MPCIARRRHKRRYVSILKWLWMQKLISTKTNNTQSKLLPFVHVWYRWHYKIWNWILKSIINHNANSIMAPANRIEGQTAMHMLRIIMMILWISILLAHFLIRDYNFNFRANIHVFPSQTANHFQHDKARISGVVIWLPSEIIECVRFPKSLKTKRIAFASPIIISQSSTWYLNNMIKLN